MKKGLGRKIKIARTEAGLTQHQLGKKLNTAHSVIATWESGKYMPNQESLRKLSQALEKPITYFFEYETEDDSIKKGSTRTIHAVREDASVQYGVNTTKLPILANMPAGLPEYTQSDVSGMLEIPRFLFPGAKFIVQIKNPSLEPVIRENDFCIIRPEGSPQDNKVMFIKKSASYEFCKTAKRKKLEFLTLNPKVKPANIKEYKIIGEVIGIIRKF